VVVGLQWFFFIFIKYMILITHFFS
jgi:hypothetical protein